VPVCETDDLPAIELIINDHLRRKVIRIRQRVLAALHVVEFFDEAINACDELRYRSARRKCR
jgi:hypothetical protein